MAKVSVYNMEGSVVGDIELDDSVFGVEINEHIVHRAVVSHLANRRQGTQSAKTRGEVRGGGKKPWRQKGTGHARQGSIRAPQWKGGGVVFAPKPRDYSQKMNKKEKALAMKSVLTSKVQEGKLIVVDDIKMDEIKTKTFRKSLQSLNAEKSLVIIRESDEKVFASAHNLPAVKATTCDSINVYDMLKYGTVVISKAAVEAVQEVYA
ncbi:MAG: 50S ribosomal protein L4 [Lachnospiraceae bacterium]|nr:50S ribosomal protein L4 [Lachnospiraceae bacterium]